MKFVSRGGGGRLLATAATVALAFAVFPMLSGAPTSRAADKSKSAQSAPQPQVRFCPADGVWIYPLESQRGVQSLLLQAVAVVNPAGGPDIKIDSAELHLLSKGEVKDTRTLRQPELAKMAAAAPQIEGLNQVLPGQFCDGTMLAGAALAKAPVLAGGEALVLMHQAFAWSGPRDAVRVIVRGDGKSGRVEVSGEVPIRAGVSKTAFRFPLRGDWFVGAGPTLHSHHRWLTIEEFAYDIAKLGVEGRTYSGDGSKFSDYHAYGAPVLAAADGEVVETVNDEGEDLSAMRRPDETQEAYRTRLMAEQDKRLASGKRGIAGNLVVIAHGAGEFSMYVHLKPGSVRVEKGQKVKAGDEIAALGSSGNSTEPHLHFQVANGPDVMTAAAIPARFVDVELPLELGPRPLQSGDLVRAK